MSKQNIIVLGNCTHWSIAEALRESGFFGAVSSAVLFSMTADERDKLAEQIDDFDIVVSLEHGDWVGPLATNVLRRRLGEKLITLPTPFFSGIHSDMAYLKYGGEIARCAAVMGDYHSALILEEVKSGFSTEDIVRRYVSGESFDRLDVVGIWNDSLAELKEREKNTDIKLSDFIEQSAENGSIEAQFLSFNHPTEGLINHIASQVIQRLTGYSVDKPLMTLERHNLYSGPQWPLHPAVAERLQLPKPTNKRFKQSTTTGGGWIEIQDFVRSSVDFFTSSNRFIELNIVTPNYLAKNLK